MPYTHVLFDLDHTLLDTESSLEMAFADAMAAAGSDPAGLYPVFNEINQALWRRVETFEVTPAQVHVTRFEQFVAKLGLDAEPQLMANAFAIGMGANGDLYPQARPLLDALGGHAAMAMITNGLSDIQRARIDRLAIGDYFQVITISAEAGVSKPGPEIFDLTFDALGNPDRMGAIMIGDSLSSDIAGGINAGIDTCWYNPAGKPVGDKQPPTHTIANLADLLPLVANDSMDPVG